MQNWIKGTKPTLDESVVAVGKQGVQKFMLVKSESQVFRNHKFSCAHEQLLEGCAQVLSVERVQFSVILA